MPFNTLRMLSAVVVAILIFLTGCMAADGSDTDTNQEGEDAFYLPTIPGKSPSETDPVATPSRQRDESGITQQARGLSDRLATLMTRWTQSPEAAAEYASEQDLALENGRVLATIRVSEGQSVEEVQDALKALDGEVQAQYQSWIDAWIPVENLHTVVGLPQVEYVTEPAPVVPLPSDER